MKAVRYLLASLMAALAVSSCAKDKYVIPIGSDSVPTEPHQVKIVRAEGEKWQLLVDGSPYYVNGAAAINYFTDVKKYGGNTIRLYSVKQTAYSIRDAMDNAYKAGLMVYLGLGMTAARYLDYSDTDKVAEQKELIAGYVRQYKNHPALLCWSVGNELESSNTDNVDMWEAIGDIVKMVHEMDGNHPVTCTLAGTSSNRVANLVKYAPDIDFVSVNAYYNAVGGICDRIEESGVDLPYMITEYGPRLYTNLSPEPDRILPWSDYSSDDSQAVVEETSSEKEAIYQQVYENDIKPFESKGCLGSFAFVWGYQTQGKVLNWFSLFTVDHYAFGACDALQKCWTGAWPEARAPRIESRSDMTMNDLTAEKAIKVAIGSVNQAKVVAKATTEVTLRYHWIIFRESDHKSDGSMPDGIEGLFVNNSLPEVTFKAPSTPGAYRMYVFVLDDVNKKAASACIPFYAE